MKKVEGYQVQKEKGIILNANESYANVDEDIIEEIQNKIKEVMFQRYPEDSNASLRNAYANYIQKDPNQILAGNGSDEMLGLIIGLQIKEGKKLYTLAPDFSMYDYYVGMHNGEMCRYSCGVEDNFDVQAFIEKGKKEKVDMVLFSNPNNPTGKSISTQDILQIVEAFSDVYVIVDEAYADFADTTMLDYIEKYTNLLVTRTLSKAFALASIRCGFLIGCQETIEKLVPYKVPYNVNTLSQEVGCIVLQYVDRIKDRINYTRQEKQRVYETFIEKNTGNVTVYPSDTNYLYGKCKDMNQLVTSFQQKGIIIRYYKDDSFRITIGTKEENDLVLEVLTNM